MFAVGGFCLVMLIFFVILLVRQSAQKTGSIGSHLKLTTNQSVIVQPLPGPFGPLPGRPVRLIIPSIHVDAEVVDVGLTPQGAMDIPKGPAEVAWFQLGQRPGEIGSAVLAGHYGWFNSIPAVFDKLHTLRPGDKVFVEDDQGVTMTFVVRELRTFGSTEDASGVFSSSDGQAHLNLVTCTGIWNKAKQSYSKRLVVFAVKE